MNFQYAKLDCPRSELAAYIDGELSPREEIELEKHLAVCAVCATELNEQKRLLHALDFALEGEREFKLPENFARVVVANAESKVSGLRSPKERFNAIFVIVALFLMFLVGVGGEIKNISATFIQFGEQLLTIGSFTVHLIYNIAVGASIVLRSFGSQFAYNPSISVLFLTAFAAASVFVASRIFKRSGNS